MVYVIQVCWELAVTKPLWYKPLLCVERKTPDDGQKNCPKHVEFYSKNKFEKLVHLVGFIIRIYYDARSPERQIRQYFLLCIHLVTSRFGIFFFSWLISPSGPRPPLWGFSITLKHSTLGKTPPEEWSARRRDPYLTNCNTYKRQTSMTTAGF